MMLKSMHTGFVLAMLIALTAVSAIAQQRETPPAFPSLPSQQDRRDERIGTIEEEMKAKREIRSAEKAHKENVERARELALLGSTLNADFQTKKFLDREDFKKIDKFEKLAKKIRDSAGGSEAEDDMKDAPTDVGTALCRLSETADSLKTKVENTPKYVISAAIIDEANVLLELVRIVRTIHPKT